MAKAEVTEAGVAEAEVTEAGVGIALGKASQIGQIGL